MSEADVKIIAEDTKIFQQLVGAATSIGKGLGSIITSLTQLLNVLLADPNSVQPGRDSTTGLFQIPLTVQNATRNGPREFFNSVASAKKADGSKMYPLDVRLNCLVTRVIFSNDSTPRATGVEFLDGKSLYRADPPRIWHGEYWDSSLRLGEQRSDLGSWCIQHTTAFEAQRRWSLE